MAQPLRAALGACTLLFTMAAVPLLAQAAGQVDVRWLEPQTYTDAGRTEAERERVTQALGAHLSQLARGLPDGQTLQIEVTDLNLAGELSPFSWRDMRVLRGSADWPQMALRYTLKAAGQTVKSGQARLSDLDYSFTRRSDDLGYEKRMIDRWFKEAFGTP